MTFSDLCTEIEYRIISSLMNEEINLDYSNLTEETVTTIMGYEIVKTIHTKEIRDNEGDGRDAGIPTEEYERIFKKFLAKVPNPMNGKVYHILYKKNGMGKYNDIIIDVKGTKLVIVTTIQKFRPSHQNYMSKPGDLRTVVESGTFIFVD